MDRPPVSTQLDRSEMKNIQTDGRLTSVEEIFKLELLFAKISGGFHFEWPHLTPRQRPWLTSGYRLIIVLLTRYWSPRHFMTPPGLFSEILGQVALQNFKFFYYICQAIGYSMVFFNIRTGLKCQKLMLVLLKKRFEAKYLAEPGIARNSMARCGPIRDGGEKVQPKRGRLDILINWRSSCLAALRRLQQTINKGHGAKLSSPVNLAPLNLRRISIIRYLMSLNLLLAIYSAHVHSKLDSGQSLVDSRLATNSSELTPTLIRRANTKHRLGFGIDLGIGMGMGMGMGMGTGTGKGKGTDTDADAVSIQLGLDGLLAGSINLLIVALQASLNFGQMYGQIFMTILVTSSIADMVRYSAAFDELASSSSARSGQASTSGLDRLSCEPKPTASASTGARIGSDYTGTTYRHRIQHLRKQHLLTTRVLLQAREVLIVIRHSVCMEYLLVLLFDLARFGAVFCLLDESIFDSEYNQRTLPLIGANLGLVLMSFLMTRIGHRFLHVELEKFIQNLEESTLFDEWIDENPVQYIERESRFTQKDKSKLGKQILMQSSREHIFSSTSRSTRTTTLRLAQEVNTIWPTDWYTPDFKSCIEQVIYVLTFVATFHQLAEASFKVD